MTWKRVDLVEHPELKDLWLGKVHIPTEGHFSGFHLHTLVVDGCDEFFTTAILPSHLLPFLTGLEWLEVRRCNSVEAIFEVKDTPTNNVVIPLVEIILEELPNLRHVWNNDPEGKLSLPCLKKVVVKECKSVTSLLPASVDKSNITDLDVRNCEKLVEIVTKNNRAANEETNKESIMFPELFSLTLHNLPNLTYIYDGMQILSCPNLQKLDVHRCKLFKKFAIDDSAAKVNTSDLFQLSLDMEDVMILEKGLLRLKPCLRLTLQGFNDIDESDASAFGFFPKVPLPDDVEMPEINLSRLLIKELKLELRNLHKFESIGWVASSILTTLKVEGCASLKYLFTSSTVKCLVELQELHISNCEALESVIVDYQPHDHDVITFNRLKNLSLSKLPKLGRFFTGKSILIFPFLGNVDVTECNRLEYMFTFSTAKSLGNLNKMEISKCESLETVVLATQESGKPPQDLTLTSLHQMSLSELPKLESFFMGKSTLKFSKRYVLEVSINQCERMKTFSHGVVEVPHLRKLEIDRVHSSEKNLKAAVSQEFENRMKQQQ
ncbi:hypothetical protein PIB30_007758 [Stylosanthes scabra]|uniref:Disease resistance protein At4g27190-like leucine-rich repeats domain-containing protein n=1 Tax=Stylosanthes scabra TaxID=79078 RepID=A0ABU6Y195_9FABA|nr:hypothetical protein [Stylosanthes scabra]